MSPDILTPKTYPKYILRRCDWMSTIVIQFQDFVNLNFMEPGSPKLRMVSWNPNTKSVPEIIKDSPSSLSDNMTTDDLVYIPYMESIWDRLFY